MGIADEAKRLTGDIAASREERAQGVAEIEREAKEKRGEARDTVRGFQAARKKSGVQLKKNLGEATARRNSGVKATRAGAAGLVKGFRVARGEESTHLRQGLARDAAARESEVEGIRKGAQQTLADFRSQRREMGAKLREELAGSRATSHARVGELMKKTRLTVTGMKDSRRESGGRMRQDLAQARSDRRSGVAGVQSNLRDARAGLRGEFGEAAAAWGKLASTRGASKASAPAADAESTVAQTPDIEAKLLSLVNEHPQGITLVEVADHLGVVPIVLGRASKSLMDKGKIRKEERTYFPLAAGGERDE